jgi:hypothetical protein
MKKNKNLLLLVFAIMAVVCCKAEEPKDYATFSGKITNYRGHFITLRQFIGNHPCNFPLIKIKIADDGTFSSIIQIEGKDKSFFWGEMGNEVLCVFLKKGNELNMTVDIRAFNRTLKFKGHDAVTNEYLAKDNFFFENNINPLFYGKDEQNFISGMKKALDKGLNLLEEYKDKIDKDFYLKKQKEFSRKTDWKKVYERNSKYSKRFSYVKKPEEKYQSFIGKASPEFTNYENFKGGTSSLKDFKGKYVYIDVWSTG